MSQMQNGIKSAFESRAVESYTRFLFKTCFAQYFMNGVFVISKLIDMLHIKLIAIPVKLLCDNIF